jgi:hypothetical protein
MKSYNTHINGPVFDGLQFYLYPLCAETQTTLVGGFVRLVTPRTYPARQASSRSGEHIACSQPSCFAVLPVRFLILYSYIKP